MCVCVVCVCVYIYIYKQINTDERTHILVLICRKVFSFSFFFNIHGWKQWMGIVKYVWIDGRYNIMVCGICMVLEWV